MERQSTGMPCACQAEAVGDSACQCADRDEPTMHTVLYLYIPVKLSSLGSNSGEATDVTA